MVIISIVVYSAAVIVWPARPIRQEPGETPQNYWSQECALRSNSEKCRAPAQCHPMPDKNDCRAHSIHAHKTETLRPARSTPPKSSSSAECTHSARLSDR